MSTRFGSIQYKPSKANPKRIVASFPTPPEAFSQYPQLPLRISRSFATDAEYEARAWLKQQQRLLEAGVWEPESISQRKQVAASLTLNEYWQTWITERRTQSGAPLSDQTRYRMTLDYRNHIAEPLGSMRLIDIDRRTIDTWLDSLPADQESMRHNALKLLLSILRTAATPGTHGEPALIPEIPYQRAYHKVRAKHEIIPATPDQVRTIYEAMPQDYRLAIYLAVFCRGLRISEVCALQRKHIDATRHILHIRQARLYMSTNMIGSTKTEGSTRDEVIPDTLIPIINTHLAQLKDQSENAWLFPAKTNINAPVHPNSMRKWFSQARAEAERPDLRFHDLRHTALTWLAQDGATLRELMESAGHTTTENALRYQHAAADRNTALADKLGSRLITDDPASIQARIQTLTEQIEVLTKERNSLTEQLNQLS